MLNVLNVPNVPNMLTLYNTQTKRKSPFKPLEASNVRVYVCGPTVYDDIHIGNARPMVVFDVLVRLLRRLYPHVTYARNITDIDDKIIARANKNNESTATLSQRMVGRFHEQMAALGVLPPDKEPLATQHIDTMIDLIETLLRKNHAYVAEGHVLCSMSHPCLTTAPSANAKETPCSPGLESKSPPIKKTRLILCCGSLPLWACLHGPRLGATADRAGISSAQP